DDVGLTVEGKFGPKEARGSFNGGAESLSCETGHGTIRLRAYCKEAGKLSRAMSAESPSSSRLWLLALGYIPILGLLVLLLEKRDREARWHARNGQLLFAALAVVGIVATLV